VKAVIALAAGFGIAIAAFGGAMGQGKSHRSRGWRGSRATLRPEQIFIPMIVGSR